MISIKENYHQRGESIMAQGVLPFKYETGKKASGMTASKKILAKTIMVVLKVFT